MKKWIINVTVRRGEDDTKVFSHEVTETIFNAVTLQTAALLRSVQNWIETWEGSGYYVEVVTVHTHDES